MEVDEVIPPSAIERELAHVTQPETTRSLQYAAGKHLPEFWKPILRNYFAGFGKHLPPPGLV